MNWTALYAILKNSINTTKAELEQEITEKIGLTNQFLDELPEVGESGVLYFIPKDDVDPSAEDQYFMYVWDPDNTEFVLLDPDMDMSPYAKTADLANVATSGSYEDLNNKPSIPDKLSDLQDDSTHRLVTDTEKTTWNEKTKVSVNDIQKSGTKIAEITVNGIPKDIYAPYFAEDFYGFIEHEDILDPTQRIEYIGINRNYTTPYTPNLTDGSYNLGSWTGWAWLDKVKPYMVNSDGTKDYALSETDYNYKADGETPSDIANTSYDGGAFVWIPKIWKQEYMVGHDRYVKFSLTEKADYEPVGFVYGSDELEGLWIPMFYGSISDSKMMSLSGLQPDYSKTTAQQYTAITAFSNRAGFYGGPIVNTINDILIMLAKTTDLQLAYGFGNMSGYNASDTYKGVLPNAVISGGMFYGTNNSKQLNKIFHSIVLGSYQQWQRDPYILLVSRRYKVSKNYTYDLTGATYFDTGIDLARIDKQDESQNTGPFYPHLTKVIPGFGDVPVQPYNGSTVLGLCDVMYQDVTSTRVGIRFGDCRRGRSVGPRALNLRYEVGLADWSLGSSVLLFPPVGVAV